MWNATTGKTERGPFTGHTDWVRSIAFSQDGQWIVSGASDGTICVWNTTTGAISEGSPFIGHTNVVRSVAFSQDGQRIVSGSGDGTIRMWRVTAAERDSDDLTDQSRINGEGWLCGSKNELLVWIPQTHRLSLYRPSNIWIAGGHPNQLDLSSFVHGPKWATIIDK